MTQKMRDLFFSLVQKEMRQNQLIKLVVADVGFHTLEPIAQEFPDRLINVGAAEQTLVGVGVGLALAHQIPIVYTYTPFLLYRAFETIRNYLQHEQIGVKLLGVGRDQDYLAEGWSHWASEDKQVMKIFDQIKPYWPEDNQELEQIFKEYLLSPGPSYLNLKRGN